MKSIIFTAAICICFNLTTSSAQEVNITALAGKWEYESPKKKSKVLYDFALDNNFIATTERKEKEVIVKGTYQIDKKNELDRLKLSTPSESSQTITVLNVYLIKFSSIDTLKLQVVSEKEDKWHPENRKNTMTLIRKKEKLKE